MKNITENKWSYFNLKNLKPLRIVYRYDDKRGNRFYYFMDNEEIQVASGITTCFGEVSTERRAIDKWKEDNANWKHLLNISSEYGTIEHELFGDISLGKPFIEQKLETMQSIAFENGQNVDMPKKDMLAFMRFCEDTELEPLIIEGVLTWQDTKGNWLAMTIDMLAKLQVPKKVKVQVEDGIYQRGPKKGEIKFKEETQIIKEEKIIVVDFKSNFFGKEKKGFYETHKMQLIGAARAVEQNFGINVNEVYNWSPNNWKSEPSYTFYKHDINKADDALFDAYWNIIRIKGINRPRGKVFVTGLENSSDYKFISYKEYVSEFIFNEKEIIAKPEELEGRE